MSAEMYLTVKDVARLLQVSPSMVYKLIYQGKLPVVRVGARMLRVPASALPEAKKWDELKAASV